MRGSKSTVTSTIAQYEFPILESIGLLKVDFLGLSTLSVMREATRLIKERHGIEFTLGNIPYEGEEAAKEAFTLLSSGEVSGVFQVESAGMRRMLTEMKPTSFEHIVAAISLYRPGPMEYIPQYIRRMHGEEQVEYKHPLLEAILAETYGICVSGDAIVTDVRTGRRCRLDQMGEHDDFVIQGVDNQWRVASGKVVRWIDSGFKDVVRISLRNGAELKLTPDHRVLTEAGWHPIGGLAPGAYIATPPKLLEPEQPLQEVDQRRLHVVWEEVVSVEPAGVEHVYDLSVEGLHNFVANNIVVHNCVYQEQIIQILSILAGYTPGEADLVRRAIGKKKASEIEKHKKIFVAGCGRNDIDPETATAIYNDIEFFPRYGFNKCLPGDTEVVDTSSGRLVKIEDLYTGQAQLASTVTCDTTSLRLQPGRVSGVMDNGVKPVFRLTTALGRQIEATSNHPFFAFDGWRQLGQLAAGDLIAVPRILPVEGNAVWPEHEVIALGHLLAEADLFHQHSIHFYSQDAVQCDDSIRAAERKEIPAAAFELGNRQIGLLIGRMWEGADHIDVGGRSLFYVTTSERMARQLQHLLLRLGILSRLRTVEFPYRDGHTGYQLFITGNDNLTAFARQIGTFFVNARCKSQLAGLCLETPARARAGQRESYPAGASGSVPRVRGTSIPGTNQTAVLMCNSWGPCRECGRSTRPQTEIRPASGKSSFTRQPVRHVGKGDVYWDRIATIEYVGEKKTYDLEVVGTHNFVANDIVVHNSHAADYAVITVQTAYLKAHYPVEYMAAQLLVERDKTEKVVNFVSECRRMGIDVLPPDVNYSGLDFDIQQRPPDTADHGTPRSQLGLSLPGARG